MLGKRKAFRVKRSFYVKWTLPGKGFRGEGKVTNVSLLGTDLTVYTTFEPVLGDVFMIEGDLSFPKPRKAKVVWIKKLVGGMQGAQCGLQFIDVELS